MADYSKWDALARAEEAEEQREKERKREQNRANYFKDQEAKKVKYMQEQEAKKKSDAESPSGHSHSHDGHSHGGGHGHSHGGDSAPAGMQPLLEKIRRPACGCGYADVEEMKRAAAAAALEPQLTTAEKNAKKLAAVQATREHGKQLFQSGEFEQAFAVYERGVLIASGIFDLPSAEAAALVDLEVLLDLNMAACKLKLGKWKEAIDQCRMALQLDAKSVKAHFRWGVAAVGLGEYETARDHFAQSVSLDATGTCKREVAMQLADIKKREAADRIAAQKFTKQLERRMAAEHTFAGGLTTDEKEAAHEEDDGRRATDEAAAAAAAAETETETEVESREIGTQLAATSIRADA